jgi:hypothetical protein
MVDNPWETFQILSELSEDFYSCQPIDSSIVIYDPVGWSEFKLKFCNDPNGGIFSPRDLTASIGNLSEEVLVSRMAHEYFGHGMFCEFSELGREIVRLDKLVAQYETDLFGKILNPIDRVLVPDTPEGKEYLQLRSMVRDFESKNIDQYETFARDIESSLSYSYFQSKSITGGET